jgi:hypothetical protein
MLIVVPLFENKCNPDRHLKAMLYGCHVRRI